MYICILLYVKLLWCSGIPYNLWSMGVTSALSICAFCYMLNLFCVMVLHRSMLDFFGGINLKVTLAVNLKVTDSVHEHII